MVGPTPDVPLGCLTSNWQATPSVSGMPGVAAYSDGELRETIAAEDAKVPLALH